MEDIAVVGEPADATAEQLVEFWHDQHAMIVKRYQMNNSYWTERNKTLIDRHESDIQKIGAALLEEAEDRGWCDDFDKFVSRLNNVLHCELPVRTKTYTITKKYMVTVSTTIECAPDKIQDEMDAYDLDDIASHISDLDNWDEYDSEYELA